MLNLLNTSGPGLRDEKYNPIYFIVSGITRLPVLEGEVSHVEIPRTSSALGITIVGGADTPLVSLAQQYSH